MYVLLFCIFGISPCKFQKVLFAYFWTNSSIWSYSFNECNVKRTVQVMIPNYLEKLYARGKPITIGSSGNSLNNCSVLAQYTNGMRTAVKTEHKSQVALDWGQSRTPSSEQQFTLASCHKIVRKARTKRRWNELMQRYNFVDKNLVHPSQYI